jgi:hypothetical protein
MVKGIKGGENEWETGGQKDRIMGWGECNGWTDGSTLYACVKLEYWNFKNCTKRGEVKKE